MNKILPLLLLTATLAFGQTVKTAEGKFLRIDVGDYQHAVFEDREGYEISFWLNGESPLALLEENVGRWFKITYKVENQHIPEAGGNMDIEILTGAELLDAGQPKPLWSTTLAGGTLSVHGRLMEGESDVYAVSGWTFERPGRAPQHADGLETETVIGDYFTGIEVLDMNFDGHDDFRIQEFRGGVNLPWLVWLYNPEDNSFEFSQPFSDLTNPTFDAQNRLIKTHGRYSAIMYESEIFTLDAEELVRLSSDEITYTDDNSYQFVHGSLEGQLWIKHQGQGWTQDHMRDVDEDGADDYFTCDLRTAEDGYIVSLSVFSATGHSLYNHSWPLTKADMERMLHKEAPAVTPLIWVKHFFDGSLKYGARIQKQAVGEEGMDPEKLKAEALRLKLDAGALENLLTDEPEAWTLKYPATPKEGFVTLVLVPALKQFVQVGTKPF